MHKNPFDIEYTEWTVEDWIIDQWHDGHIEIHMETKTIRAPKGVIIYIPDDFNGVGNFGVTYYATID